MSTTRVMQIKYRNQFRGIKREYVTDIMMFDSGFLISNSRNKAVLRVKLYKKKYINNALHSFL